jgi:plastocyanin
MTPGHQEIAMSRVVARTLFAWLRRPSARALVACAAIAVPAVVALAAAPAQVVNVDIAKFAYGPKDITVAPGTRIVWTNHDEAPHTVTGKDKTFASEGMDTDDTFDHTFDREGDFEYLCTVHPFMTGVVHVHKP